VGVDQRRLQQHLHLLHRAEPAGTEKDRRPGDVLAEVEALVADGVVEVTLLGQNVNSYGVEFGDRQAFGKLLRACGDIDGLERVRFTSPHPKDFTSDVIEAMAQTPNVMPQLHMPLQSGSDAMLKAMRRSYRQSRFLRILDDVRAAMPHAAISTDIIVGFPGETEEDFEATMDVVRRARFAQAFTFQYSKRPGTPAADMPDQLPKASSRSGTSGLVELVNEVSWAENKRLVGTTTELPGRDRRGPQGRGDAPAVRTSARQPAGALLAGRPGRAPRRLRDRRHHVRGPAPPGLGRAGAQRRRTRAGDAGRGGRGPTPSGVSLGMPGPGCTPCRSAPPAVAPEPQPRLRPGSRLDSGEGSRRASAEYSTPGFGESCCGSSRPRATTWLRPARFASYSASSAWVTTELGRW
jgi:tRNA-2-methylthio-N6-dimethylallyladenosine synthase